jgi:hypothetical protein
MISKKGLVLGSEPEKKAIKTIEHYQFDPQRNKNLRYESILFTTIS